MKKSVEGMKIRVSSVHQDTFTVFKIRIVSRRTRREDLTMMRDEVLTALLVCSTVCSLDSVFQTLMKKLMTIHSSSETRRNVPLDRDSV